MEALKAKDPENDDSFTFLMVFTWALKAQDPKNDDSCTFSLHATAHLTGHPTGQDRLLTPPPALEVGRSFSPKTKVLAESGANFGKAGFGIPFRRFYSVNLRTTEVSLLTEGCLERLADAC